MVLHPKRMDQGHEGQGVTVCHSSARTEAPLLPNESVRREGREETVQVDIRPSRSGDSPPSAAAAATQSALTKDWEEGNENSPLSWAGSTKWTISCLQSRCGALHI